MFGFFIGWRRKRGVVTLPLACVLIMFINTDAGLYRLD